VPSVQWRVNCVGPLPGAVVGDASVVMGSVVA
jgi:hypothetical protein